MKNIFKYYILLFRFIFNYLHIILVQEINIFKNRKDSNFKVKFKYLKFKSVENILRNRRPIHNLRL